VTAFDIFLANGEHRTIFRQKLDAKKLNDPDGKTPYKDRFGKILEKYLESQN
jgi:hypothetical protein